MRTKTRMVSCIFGQIERRPAQTLLLAAVSVWLGLILTTPLLGWDWVHTFFSTICHQNPERSWHLGGEPFAACIRCTSIYAGFLIALMVDARPDKRFLICALGLTAIEFTVARLLIDMVAARTVTGLLLGSSAAGFVAEGVGQLFGRGTPERNSLENV